MFVAGGIAFRLAGETECFCAAKRFSSDEEKSLGPVFTQGDVYEARIFCAQLSEFARVGRCTENYGGRGFEGPQDVREFAVAQWADHNQVVLADVVVPPEIAAKNGDARRLPFGSIFTSATSLRWSAPMNFAG